MFELGFASAIVPDLDLPETLALANRIGYRCVEIMCWPPSQAERRYAGITHIDVSRFDASQADEVRLQLTESGIRASALGYYPNCLDHDAEVAAVAVAHLKKVIRAASALSIGVVTTFVGRDHTLSVEDNWPKFLQTWRPLIQLAETEGVRIAIENCPMTFTRDEWPGGKNLAFSPAIWRRMFDDIPSQHFGLNYDPSHLVWMGMNYTQPLWEFREKLFHVHAKDVQLDQRLLDEHGSLAYPNLYHRPKLPGLGDVQWGRFLAVLGDVGYRGPVCVEVEDRNYEGSLAGRQAALSQSFRYLSPLMPTDWEPADPRSNHA